jgi:NADH:ubiquinone oxidoreductase subunit 5 (subunit L)/multisubunit Na+/H+ antiporter MnhA subunit
MNELLPYAMLIPFVGFLANLVLPDNREKLIFGAAISTVVLHALFLLTFTVQWILGGGHEVHSEAMVLYQTHNANFSIDFFFDVNTAVYFWVSSVLTFLVLIFSRYYIHREKGFKRFFNNILFF